MADERVRLIQALGDREGVAGFSTKLEEINSTAVIDQELYKQKNEEYARKLESISAEIVQVKEALKKQLSELGLNLSARKADLAKLEISYKVGEIPFSRYQSAERPLRAEIVTIQQNIEELNLLISADSVAACPVLQKPSTAAAPPVSATAPRREGLQERAVPAVLQKAMEAAAVSFSAFAKWASAMKLAFVERKGPNAPGPQRAFPFSEPLSEKGATFDFRMKPLHLSRMASLATGLLMVLAIAFPWANLPGLGLSIFFINGWIAAGCLIFLLAFIAATFLARRRARSLSHVACALVCIVFWLIFRFTDFQDMSSLAISRLSMMGIGSVLFIAAAAIGVLIGVAEMFPAIDRQVLSFSSAGVTSIRLFLTAVIVLSSFVFPKPVSAWASIKFNWTIASLIAGGDLTTHQAMLNLAYAQLADDPAFADQKEAFPSLNGIQSWEGVTVNWAIISAFSGGSWSDPLRGGPDAGGKSRDSEHMYNPSIGDNGKGGAPTSVEYYYKALLGQIYNEDGMIRRPQMADAANKDAAWSAHYLADVHVPYHVVGMPADDVPGAGNNFTEQQLGPAYLWQSSDCLTFDKDGNINIDPGSLTKPRNGWGKNGDFSADAEYFKIVQASDQENHDWFDPWYYNGWFKGAGGYLRLATASHGQWESWAHQNIDTLRYYMPSTYAQDWENATPTFGMPQKNIEDQAAKAKAFTISAARETRAKLPGYLKKPSEGFNRSVQRMVTLWRASITALRPTATVNPDPANPKLLKVTAIISSLEPADPAQNVQAKLSVTGGTIRGDAIQGTKETITVTHSLPRILNWDVDSANPDTCKFKLEVIGKYKKTPDLQYAVIEPVKNQFEISVSPSNVDAGQKIMISVKLQPAITAPPTIKEWGPLEQSGNFSQQSDGSFRGEFTVKKGTKDGPYTVLVEARERNLTRSANIRVGKGFNTCAIDFQIGVTMGGDGNPVFTHNTRFGMKATGSLTGQKFEGTITETYADDVLVEQGGSTNISVTIIPTADPKVFQITDYQLSTPYACSSCYVPVKKGNIQMSGKRAVQAQLDPSRNVVTGKVSGESVRSYIDSFNWTIQYLSYSKPDNKTVYDINKLVGTSVSYLQITFQNK